MIRPLVLAAALVAFTASVYPREVGAATSSLVPAAGTGIDLSVNQGQLVRLAKPVNSVFIADPAIADVQVKSPTLVYVLGKASGTTTLYAVSAQDEVMLNSPVRVHYDAARVAQAIHELVPRSAVAVNAVADSLILSGTVYSASDGDDIRSIANRFVKDPKQVINKMQVSAPNQINLRVRIAEVSRSIVKEFGINWQNVFNNNHGFIFGLAEGATTLVTPNTTAGSPALPSSGSAFFTTPNAFNTGASGQFGSQLNNLFGGVHTKTLNLNTLIDALDNHGLITVLAEPNLTAISGEPANFLAGGEFPVPVPAGTGLVGIDWKKFGVSLNFVATIESDDHISLHVMPEVSELSTQGAIVIDSISVPALTTRRAETTVDLASGQSFAIAGLLQNNVSQNIDKFPWLGDVPVLGQLFRSEAFQRDESELVIIVTPYLVHPIATASNALDPTTGFVPSTDGQLVLHANEYQPQPPATHAAPPPAGQSHLVGPVGFDLD